MPDCSCSTHFHIFPTPKLLSMIKTVIVNSSLNVSNLHEIKK